MIAMAYTILKLHRKTLLKMGMDELMEFLQKTLEVDFGYEDDFVVETALRESMAELRSARLHSAGPPPDNELPQKPFGLVDIPSKEQERLVGHRTPIVEQEKELHRNSLRRETVNTSDLINVNDSLDSIQTPISVRRQIKTETETQVYNIMNTPANAAIENYADTKNYTSTAAMSAPTMERYSVTIKPLPPSFNKASSTQHYNIHQISTALTALSRQWLFSLLLLTI